MLPSQIVTDINNLLTGVTAAAPLSSASRLLIQDLQSQADQTLTDITSAAATAAGNLDAADPTGYPGDMVSDLLELASSSENQYALVMATGLVGRAAFNLAQSSS